MSTINTQTYLFGMYPDSMIVQSGIADEAMTTQIADNCRRVFYANM